MEGSPWQPDLDWKQRDKELVDDFSWSEEDLSDRVATPFKFVSVGRGSRKRQDPQDVRLPRIFLDRIRQKNFPRRPAGRGNILKTFSSQSLSGSIQPQDSLWMTSQASPSSLSEDFLGAASRGLTSDILAGKACLMEKFLGKPMAGQGGFNPFGNKHQRSSGSLRSTQTAPLLDFSSREQWPGVGASACQFNCGKNGPKKSLSLQDALNAISRTPNQWDRASLDSSGKGSGDGSRKWRRTKRSQGRVSQGQNGSQDKEGAPRMNGSEGVAACSTVGSALPENGSKERGSENDLSGTSRQEEEGIPGGANLIQVECLPEDITEEHLTSVMYGFGPVIDCNILRDNDSQKCIGIAFVRFETSEACSSAISALHEEDSPFHKCSGKDEEIPKLLVHMVL